ncbi:MAG: aminomethyl-transferring glycine dehydrogenase subunit GcvPA [Acidobacteria bacterium]|nr:aminomethyl-transferring glycine dehydrogenase subunit GcvPA [Acidobacteriota bacterium]
MRRYLPLTEEEIREMLTEIGVKDIDDLFAPIPEEVRLRSKLSLPSPLTEPELIRHIKRLAQKNAPLADYSFFIGGGAYRHFIPVAIDQLISRSEFYTAYTPYQPEISQGTLQAIFEYQTLICQLTGMEVANASMYEGGTALAEAILMARRINKRSRVIISEAVHPEYRQVVATYLQHLGAELIEIPVDETGKTDYDKLASELNDDTSSVVVQYPNFFGVVEELAQVQSTLKERGALFIVAIGDPVSLGILKPPSDFGADIVVGEGQGFGLPLSYGGPYLGFMATKEKYVRQMPGRLVGETVDKEGNVGYVLTLSTREQHIRRERATSNICTNESLCALSAVIYLSLLGKEGIREVAIQSLLKSAYAKEAISRVSGFKLRFSGATFNEFVVESEDEPGEVRKRLLREKILFGIPLGRFYPKLSKTLLVTVTEVNTREEIDRLVKALEG